MNRQTLHLALVELKNRGFMSIELSDQELDEWLTGLVEVKTRAAAAGDRSAAEDARELSSSGGIIRFETFRNAVEFAEEKGFNGMTRKDVLNYPTWKYGTHPLCHWKELSQEPSTEVPSWFSGVQSLAFKKILLDVLEYSFVGLVVIWLPSYYIIPWYIFRFSDDRYKNLPAKKDYLKKYRIENKRAEFFDRFRF